eukprot:gene30300-34197_t
MATACRDCLVPFTSGIYTGLSGLSTLFFMIGAIGYTATKDTISDIPWIYGTFDGFPDDNSYFSLRAEYDDFQTDGGVFKYATYSMPITTIGARSARATATKADFSFAHFVAAAISGVACFISGIALIVFMGVCQSKIKKFYSGDQANVVYPEFHWGAGSILVA